MPSNIDLGTVFTQGLSIVTAGNSAVSAWGTKVGREVAVVALSPGANASVDTTFTVLGAAAGDIVTLGPPSSLSAGLIAFGFVSAQNEVTLRLATAGASHGTVAQTAQTWNVDVHKRSFVTRIN